MGQVFVYGTLRHLPLLERVLGRSPMSRGAFAPDHKVLIRPDDGAAVLVPHQGAQADGLVFDASAQDMRRLCAYELPYGYRLGDVALEAGGRAQVFLPDPAILDPAPDWPQFDLALWEAQSADLALEVARELIERLDHEPPEVTARHLPAIGARAQARRNAGLRLRGDWGSDLGADDVKITAQELVYSGFFNLRQLRLRHRRFDGAWGDEITRLVLEMGEAVTVLPYDPIRDRVAVIEQYRPAASVQGDPHPWLIEPVAGICDAGETHEDTARREAREEAGLEIGALHLVGRYYPTPGGVAQVLVSYVGLCDLPDDLAALHGLADEGEDIRLHLLPFAQVMAILDAGHLTNAPLLASALWLDRFRQSRPQP